MKRRGFLQWPGGALNRLGRRSRVGRACSPRGIFNPACARIVQLQPFFDAGGPIENRPQVENLPYFIFAQICLSEFALDVAFSPHGLKRLRSVFATSSTDLPARTAATIAAM